MRSAPLLFLTLSLLSPAKALSGPAGSGPREQKVAFDDAVSGFRSIENWRVDDAQEVAERAYRRDPDHPLTLALLAELKMHMSDYVGAVEFFRRAKAGGAPETLLSDAPLAEAARVATDGYAETISEYFIIRHQPGRDEILVPYALETLEKARKNIGDLLGWAPRSRIVVEFYPSAGTLASVSTLTRKEIETSGTIALCRWNRLMVTTPRAVVFGYSWRDTLAHELTHLIIGGASKNTVPIWLHEGLAKYSETAWREGPGFGISLEQELALRKAARGNQLIPFSKMHPSMAKLKSQEETSLAFAEVFTMIEYLVSLKGWAGIREILERMSQGASDIEAIEAVVATSFSVITNRWMASLKTRKIVGTDTTGGVTSRLLVKDRANAPDDKLHGVSKKGRRYARAADLLYARGRLKAAQAELEKAFRETRSPLIGGKLAIVALASGDLDAAEGAARAASESTPDLAGPSVTLAEILVRKGKLSEARAPLDRALGVNPFDPRIHQLLLAMAPAETNPKRALALLGEEGSATYQGIGSGPGLGHGGLVEVVGARFSRVYVLPREGSGQSGLNASSVATGMSPTGMVTPTAPFRLRPGPYGLLLVPPVGAPFQREIHVVRTPDGGEAQRILETPDGS